MLRVNPGVSHSPLRFYSLQVCWRKLMVGASQQCKAEVYDIMLVSHLRRTERCHKYLLSSPTSFLSMEKLFLYTKHVAHLGSIRYLDVPFKLAHYKIILLLARQCNKTEYGQTSQVENISRSSCLEEALCKSSYMFGRSFL